MVTGGAPKVSHNSGTDSNKGTPLQHEANVVAGI